jgi:sterol desaturase/sphingolipid hydroxylase (fatty acid hydroxylase superfamily)
MYAHNALVRWFYLFIVVAVAIEIAWYSLVRKRDYPWREMLTSVTIFVMRMPVQLLAAVIVMPTTYFLWPHRVATIPLNTAWGLALLFFGEELAYYWMHRAGHEIRWMWASHVVHHTPEQIHLASAFRLGATEVLSGNWLFYLPLFFIGFSPEAVGAMLAINLFYQFWLHTDLIGRLGPLSTFPGTSARIRVSGARTTRCERSIAPIWIGENSFDIGAPYVNWARRLGRMSVSLPSCRH